MEKENKNSKNMQNLNINTSEPTFSEPSQKKNVWKIVSIILIGIVIIFSLLVWYGFHLEKQDQNLLNNNQNNNMSTSTTEDSKNLNLAITLVQTLAEHDKYPDFAENLTQNFTNKIAYGGGFLQYVDASSTLTVCIFASRTYWKTATDEQKENFRKTLGGLNDPKNGGMYERAGGYFMFDEERGYYLCRDFQVDQVTPDEFISTVEFLRTVTARWTTEWLFEVAQATHGHRLPPKEPVKYIPR